MASELKAASSYTSVSRTNDNGSAWTAGGTLGTDDSNSASSTPYKAGGIGVTGCNSQILRVAFGAFSLPLTDAIFSVTLAVKHKQGRAAPTSGSIIFENNSDEVISSITDITSTVSLSPSSFTISSLNAGTATVDLLYRGTGENTLLNECPSASVNYVTLTVVTGVPSPSIDPFSASSISRIPALGVN